MSTTALAVVQGSYTMAMRAESWLGGQLLTDAVPIADGNEDRDRSLAVPEKITLTVPRRDRGFDWDPGADPAHPLAAYGQMLRIDYGIDVGNGYEWINQCHEVKGPMTMSRRSQDVAGPLLSRGSTKIFLRE
ncbi:hypothetical protein, partial [Streptomyces sp. NPDC048663]|uniref:hypothetical protein n=1 Tax=Streptomyces sp. NPDC048663 TaxID=3155638 RepID=UPI00342CCBDD